MAQTRLRQPEQIHESDTFDDTLAAGATLQSASVSLQDDLNALRSQAKRILGEAAWYAALSGRSLSGLSTDLADIEGKKLLFRTQLLTDISVTAAQNWELLSVAASEAPSEVAAVALTQVGAVVAQSALSGAGFNVAELTELAGQNAVSPKNLVTVRDSTTGQLVQSSGRDVFGLLQYESTGADGAAFDDTSAGNRVKISFVRLTSGLSDLEACPVADIAGKTINYAYVRRINLDAVPEDSFVTSSTFVDFTATTGRSKTVAVVTAANIPADTNVTGAGGSPNIDAQLGDYSTLTFLTGVDVYLNGELMRNGANAAANNDVYPGTTPANGDLKFEFNLKINDVITMIFQA